MFTTVGDKVFTIVNGLVSSTDLNFAYNYEKKIGDSGYPYATVTPVASTERLYSSNANLLEVPYVVAIYVRNASIAIAEQTCRGIVDDVMAALRADVYLTGTAHAASFDIERGYADDEQPTRVATIKATYTILEC